MMTDQEINEAVARKLGWVFITEDQTWFRAAQTRIVHSDPRDYLETLAPEEEVSLLPDYCNDIDAAWEIVEKWKVEGPHFSIGDNGSEGWFVQIEGEGIETFCEVAATAPLAICLAFLKLPS